MFTEFYQVLANSLEQMGDVNQRVATVVKAVGDIGKVTIEEEREGVYLYITIKYGGDEPVPFSF